MNKPVQAVFEGGVLKPLEPLSLAEHELVSLMIERSNRGTGDPQATGDDDWADRDILELANLEGDASLPLEQLHDELKSIRGSLSDLVIAERGDY